jgi:diguanylate cyclase (GGDEF)-like protein/PAS domain S-box-containing protein
LTDLQKPRPLSRKVPWQLIFVFILLAAGLSALSRVFYVLQIGHSRAFMESELATVAGLKAQQIREWLDAKLAFAAALQETRANAETAKALAADPGLEPARTQFLNGMKGLQKSLPFTKVELVLPRGRTLLTYPEDAAVAATPESSRIGHEAWESGKPIIGSVELDEKTGRRAIDLMVPLLAGEGPGTPVALLRMTFDPAAEIDPLLNDWPNRRRSAEAILLRIDSGNFVRLSLPRFYDAQTPPPPIPVANFRRPASQAALGEEGIIEGTDYRGRPVLEYLRAVPGTPWLVAVKTDLADLTSGMTGANLSLAIGAVALILISGALLFIFWRRGLALEEAAERSKWDEANKSVNDFMQLMIDIMPNPAFLKGTDGLYRGTNAAFEKLLGHSKSEIIGHSIADVASADIVKTHEEHDLALLAKPGHQVYEAPFQAWDGEHRIIFIKATYLCPDGTVGGILGILKDITQRLRTEEELEELRQFSDSTVQTMTEGLVLTDTEGRFTLVNPAAARMLGYTPAEMIDQPVISFVPGDQHEAVRRADEKRQKGISDRYELAFLHRDGSRKTFLVSGGPRVQAAQFGGTMAVLTDITDRKRMEEEIRALSLHDELTGLCNRRGFLTLAEMALKTATRMKKATALIYLDLDDLKKINDAGGHKMGDRALVEIGYLLRNSFRESDVIGRLGGDEFAVLAMESDPMDTDLLTRRLQDRLEIFNTRSAAEAGFRLSVSFGVSVREPDGPGIVEELLSRADLQMYEQKRAKKKGQADKPPGPSK